MMITSYHRIDSNSIRSYVRTSLSASCMIEKTISMPNLGQKGPEIIENLAILGPKTRNWEKQFVNLHLESVNSEEKSIYLKNRPKRGSWWGANVIFGGKNLTILMKMGVETWKKVPEKRRFSN